MRIIGVKGQLATLLALKLCGGGEALAGMPPSIFNKTGSDVMGIILMEKKKHVCWLASSPGLITEVFRLVDQ